MVEIRLLGEQRIAAGPDPGSRTSSRSLGLLAYLVLHAGIPQPRQRLAGIFWPGSTESQARTNLRRELHHLRALLGDTPSLVVKPTDLVWADSPSCRVDVRVFRAERELALAARAAQDRDGVVRHAAAAIGEYRDELMPGNYDGWVLDERERLRRECVELCDLLGAAHREAGDAVGAAEVLRRRIELEPLEEAGYRALMDLQAESGDLAAAISTYHRCATVLEHELGIDPSPETTAAVEQLLGRGSTAPRPVGVAQGSRRIGAAGPRLLGRDRELGTLARRWEQARRGAAGLLVVSGDAGVGKSRLVAELTAIAEADDAAIAVTRCFGLTGRLALAPVADWLRSSPLREAAAGLDPMWRAEVERLIPDPARRAGPPRAAPAGSRAIVDAWQRHRFFEGLANAVLAVGRPTLLVLDDLQWCDQETLAWLAYLLRLADGTPLLVVGTLRPDELDQNRDVAGALRSMRAEGRVTDLGLEPLDPTGTGLLVASLLGRAVTADEQALLHAATGGYPLFVVEAARSAPEQPAQDRPPAKDLRSVLRHRLEQASPEAQEAACLAAALGRDFRLDLLSEACDLRPNTLVGAVDELWRRRILREQGGSYDFSHDLVRDAAYAEVSPPRRWLLHRRLAEGLELLHAGHTDDVAAELAEQYERAGRPDRAVHYSARAADAAEAVFAHAEAVRQRRRCLGLVRQLPAGRERDLRELEVLHAMVSPLNVVQGYASLEVQRALERSAALAQHLDQPVALLRSLAALFAVRFVQGHNVQAHQLGQQALALAGEDAALAGPAHFAVAGSATSLGRPETAVAHFDLAGEMTGGVPVLIGPRLDVHAMAWSAHAHWLLGHDDEADLRSAEAVQRGRASGEPYNLAVAVGYAAITHQMRGDVDAVVSAVEELGALCRRYEFAYYGEWAPILEGWVRGGDRGAALIEQGIGGLRAQGAPARMPYWLSLLAEVLLGSGHRDAARAALDAARVGAEHNADRWWLPEVLRMRAGLEPPQRSAALLRRAAALAAQQGSVALEQRCRAALAEQTPRVSSRPATTNALRTLPS